MQYKEMEETGLSSTVKVISIENLDFPNKKRSRHKMRSTGMYTYLRAYVWRNEKQIYKCRWGWSSKDFR